MIRIGFRTRPTCWVDVQKFHGVNKLVDVRYLELGSPCVFSLGHREDPDPVELVINEGYRFPLDGDWDPEDIDPDFLDRRCRSIHIRGLVLYRNPYAYLVEITHVRDARYDHLTWYPVAMFLTDRSMHAYIRPPESP